MRDNDESKEAKLYREIKEFFDGNPIDDLAHELKFFSFLSKVNESIDKTEGFEEVISELANIENICSKNWQGEIYQGILEKFIQNLSEYENHYEENENPNIEEVNLPNDDVVELAGGDNSEGELSSLKLC